MKFLLILSFPTTSEPNYKVHGCFLDPPDPTRLPAETEAFLKSKLLPANNNKRATFPEEKLEKRKTKMKREIFLLSVAAAVMSMSSVSVVAQNGSGSYVTAFNVLGDSSVDCGENTLFYPILHHNLSLLPCNGSDSTLLPHHLGTSLALLALFLGSFLCFTFLFLNSEKGRLAVSLEVLLAQ